MALPQNRLDYCVWFVAGMVALSAISKIRLLPGILDSQHLWEQVVIALFFVSAVFGVIGLLRSNHWGFVFVYIYIVIATFVLSISVIPFLLGVLDSRAKTATAVLFTINGAMFAFTAFLHVSKSKKLGRRAGRKT
jgi:hypothetical protein